MDVIEIVGRGLALRKTLKLICLCLERENPHLCVFPLPSLRLDIHPFVAPINDKVISPSADGDQGFAFGNHKLLKKLDQNF